jgi:hypothetical protein
MSVVGTKLTTQPHPSLSAIGVTADIRIVARASVTAVVLSNWRAGSLFWFAPLQRHRTRSPSCKARASAVLAQIGAMSAIGTKRTWRAPRRMSAIGGKADIAGAFHCRQAVSYAADRQYSCKTNTEGFRTRRHPKCCPVFGCVLTGYRICHRTGRQLPHQLAYLSVNLTSLSVPKTRPDF